MSTTLTAADRAFLEGRLACLPPGDINAFWSLHTPLFQCRHVTGVNVRRGDDRRGGTTLLFAPNQAFMCCDVMTDVASPYCNLKYVTKAKTLADDLRPGSVLGTLKECTWQSGRDGRSLRLSAETLQTALNAAAECLALRKCMPSNSIVLNFDMPYTADDYVTALMRANAAPHHVRMLLAHYHAPARTLTAGQLSKALGYAKHGAANLHYGGLGRLVGECLGWATLPAYTVSILVTFDETGDELRWVMRPALAEALERLGWVDGTHPGLPEEIPTESSLYEGAARRVSVNAYERNAEARERCILHYGCRCAACGLALVEQYGEVARGLIHVHHLRQLAEVNAQYRVDPVRDLRPVCPTCHAVIHSRTPPFTVEEVAQMVEDQKARRCEPPAGTGAQ